MPRRQISLRILCTVWTVRLLNTIPPIAAVLYFFTNMISEKLWYVRDSEKLWYVRDNLSYSEARQLKATNSRSDAFSYSMVTSRNSQKTHFQNLLLEISLFSTPAALVNLYLLQIIPAIQKLPPSLLRYLRSFFIRMGLYLPIKLHHSKFQSPLQAKLPLPPFKKRILFLRVLIILPRTLLQFPKLQLLLLLPRIQLLPYWAHLSLP